MIIQELEVENWKCFRRKQTFSFDKHELITMQNGTGKTSIFQAVLFAVWGKTPVGFNMNTVRNDDTARASVRIKFLMDAKDGERDEFLINRVFGTSSPVSEMSINGNLVCESVRTIADYMDKILNFDIVKELWTSDLINSEIVSADFFTKIALNDILDDPNQLLVFYKTEVYSKNKTINGFNEEILDKVGIEQKMQTIRERLKERNNLTSSDLDKAKVAAEAKKSITSVQKRINKLLNDSTLTEYSESEAKAYLTLLPNKDTLQKNLAAELEKKDTPYSSLNLNELRKVLKLSEDSHSCIICHSDFNSDKKKAVEEEIEKTGRDESKILDLHNRLKSLEVPEDLARLVVELEDLNRAVEKSPNFKEIINSYNAENQKLWNDYESLQTEYNNALRQEGRLLEINKLKAEVVLDKEKIAALNNYIESASKYHTKQLMDKASGYLEKLNGRYKQIAIMDGAFHIVVEQEDFALNILPITRLSNGEKTICALSLLFSVHNLMVPELPLLFDETFQALDRENLSTVQEFLRIQESQVFIITHDKEWKEF